jgi:hypothetical protein
MRGYLANIVVTPRAEWIGLESPQFFPTGSEFVEVVPNDGLVYFWWAYLHKKEFLDNLPKGHGGTRPRIKPESIGGMPASAPELDARKDIDSKLGAIAEHEWRSYVARTQIMKSIELM